MTNRTEKHGLQVASELADFIDARALDGTGIDSETFWKSFAALVAEMTPRNRAMLQKREDLQGIIDAWHVKRRGQQLDRTEYEAFLHEIG
ncbi:MAG: malate synthase G, partial [Paracoccaceae bacterium]|nr:malate synthase G [Paracoccaceae bacterium]